MANIFIELAEKIVNIQTDSPFIERFCNEFITDKTSVDITVKAQKDEV